MSRDIPPGTQCYRDGCTREAVNPDHPAGFCERHIPGGDVNVDDDVAVHGTDEDPGTVHTASENGSVWDSAEFTTPDSGVWPSPHTEREQWMARSSGDKAPWAPWADDDAPVECSHTDHDDATTCDQCAHSAAYKWGSDGSREHVHTDAEMAREWATMHPKCNGDLVYIQREDSPFAFIDGDDVRCPETNKVHPAFLAILEHLGATYADVSTSGSGVHAVYRGELPVDGKGQATFEIDTDPWGANDAAPTVEVYANKHVCVMTGDHVPGTPAQANEWDAKALRAILEAHGYDDSDSVVHDTDRERADLTDHDPDATGRDETASDVKDILAAVDRLEPRDVCLSTTRTGKDSTGWSTWDPSYRTSESGTSLHYNGEGVFYDHKKGEDFGVLRLIACEEGIISDPWDRLAGSDWWEAVEIARDRGASIPKWTADEPGEQEHVAVLPPAVRTLSGATNGWDWKHAATRDESAVTKQGAHERTTEAIADAYNSGDCVLIEALPTMGKSHGAVAAVEQTDEQVTILTGRGRKEQYGQFKDWCEQRGLEYKQLPAFTETCPTASGAHGDEWRETVMDWYRRGATPQEIHNRAEYELDRPLPCQVAETGEEIECTHRHAWNFNADDYDVLIGHYVHAHTEQAVGGRTVVFDEFPDAYELNLGVGLKGAISYWLQSTDGVPFADATDLLENRSDQARRGEALLWFEEHGVEPDEDLVFQDSSAHAYAPLAVYTILAADNLGNGFESASLPEGGRGVYNRETTEVSLLRPPALDYASGVVALDGTPTKQMWELVLGTRLNHQQVLQGEERADYIRNALNLNIIRTTDAVKPYNSADHVTTEQDAALLEAIADQHDQRPALITTATAEQEYSDMAGDLFSESKHFGNVLGSNEFKTERVGAVIGSNHYGDVHIQKWGAYAEKAVERNGGKGKELSYGRFGDKILTHMREHETLQATMRFGRDGNGAVVYVHTDTLPEWVPVAGEGRVTHTRGDGEREVLRALQDLPSGDWRVDDVADHPEVSVGQRQVLGLLNRLVERGVLERRRDPDDGRRVVYHDDGIHRVSEHGDVDLAPVSLDDLDDDEITELARTSTYTWYFASSLPSRDRDSEHASIGAGGIGIPAGDTDLHPG